jgi:hypothetical protein
MTQTSSDLLAKNMKDADETRRMGDLARVDIVQLGEIKAARAIFQPGFHWTEHARPVVGTDLCPVHHVGYVISGRAHVRLADGTECEFSAGDVFDVPPGHDTWVIGDEPYVSIEIDPGNALR